VRFTVLKVPARVIAISLLSAIVFFGGRVFSHASRLPNTTERRDIQNAVEGFFTDWYYGALYRQLNPPRARILSLRVSTVDSHFALARVSAKAFRDTPPFKDIVILWRGATAKRGPSDRPITVWAVIEVGSHEYGGCGLIPDAVSRDLVNVNFGC